MIGSQLLALHCPRAKKYLLGEAVVVLPPPLLCLGKFVLQRERERLCVWTGLWWLCYSESVNELTEDE